MRYLSSMHYCIMKKADLSLDVYLLLQYTM